MKKNLIQIPYFTELKNIITYGGFEAYFVGGCVRDVILGRDVHDIDMVCFSHEYKDFAGAIKAALPSVWVEFKDNIRLVRGRVEIDVSKPRGETLEEDLLRRDFTINNLAMNTDGDILGDVEDIGRRVIRHTGDDAFTDDPLRILRAFRFQAQLGFRIADSTISKIENQSILLGKSASERIFAELDKLFRGSYTKQAMEHMANAGVYRIVTGGLEPDCVSMAAASAGRGLGFFAAALFTGMDQDERLRLAGRLNFPNVMRKTAVRTAAFAERTAEVLKNGSDFDVRKMLYASPDVTDAGLALFAICSRCAGTDEYAVEECVDRVMTQVKYVDFELPEKLSGAILQEIGIPPGPKMGEVIKEVKPLMASGELKCLYEAEEYITDKYVKR